MVVLYSGCYLIVTGPTLDLAFIKSHHRLLDYTSITYPDELQFVQETFCLIPYSYIILEPRTSPGHPGAQATAINIH